MSMHGHTRPRQRARDGQGVRKVRGGGGVTGLKDVIFPRGYVDIWPRAALRNSHPSFSFSEYSDFIPKGVQ